MSFLISSKVEFEFVVNDSEIVECQENKIQEFRSSHTFQIEFFWSVLEIPAPAPSDSQKLYITTCLCHKATDAIEFLRLSNLINFLILIL